MTFFGRLSVCVRITGNVTSMGIGDRLARLRSRWAGLVGRRFCDSAGAGAICRTAHRPSLGLCWQWAVTHTHTAVLYATRTCHLSQTEAVLFCCFTHVTTVRNHSNRAVIMRLHSLETCKPLRSYSVCNHALDLLQVIRQCFQHLFTCTQWAIDTELHCAPVCVLELLEIQRRLVSAATYPKSKQQWQDPNFHEHSVRRDYACLILLGFLPHREWLGNMLRLWRMLHNWFEIQNRI